MNFNLVIRSEKKLIFHFQGKTLFPKFVSFFNKLIKYQHHLCYVKSRDRVTCQSNDSRTALTEREAKGLSSILLLIRFTHSLIKRCVKTTQKDTKGLAMSPKSYD